MSFGVDYAFSPHPSVAALKAAGCAFVCRYTSSQSGNDANGKNLQAAEKNAILAAGMSVVIVAEEGAQRMKGGHSIGATDAGHADAVVKALGMPTIPIYFACDYDAPESDQPAINAYLDGVASVIGHARTGIYGGYWPLSRARSAGKASYFWGTVAWSGTNWVAAGWENILQGLQVTVGGVSVDVDHSLHVDYGQWPRPAAPKPPVPPGPGPFRHVFAAGESFASVAKARNTTALQLWETSMAAYTPADHQLLRHAVLPGVAYYTKKP